jgi:hypothetical protein
MPINFSKFFTRKLNFTGSAQDRNKNVRNDYITLSTVHRKRNMTEEQRRAYATEQLDTYRGFGIDYLRGLIKQQISSQTISINMQRLAVALPLLNKFVSSVSRVYSQNPVRTFYIDDKQIVSELPSDISDKNKFLIDPELLKTLEGFYSKEVIACVKEAEKLTNLLKTTVYKVITDDNGKIRIKFIENDTIQICQDMLDPSVADQIAYIRDDYSSDRVYLTNTRILEEWNAEIKSVPVETDGKLNQYEESQSSINEAAVESEKLFETKQIGYAFAPFVVFRESDAANSFWNLKDADTFDYIRNINMSLTELRYLVRYASFGLKYVVNGKMDETSQSDPTGFLNIQSLSRNVGDSPNIQVGEFENKGRIKEVIESILFNLKMLYDSYNLPFDSLTSTNQVMSAENKQMDNEELFADINSQRDMWAVNEENLFKVMQCVHNRDNQNQIPKGVSLRVNYEEQKTQEKTNEDWMVEVQNNISSVLDWISSENPDLNRDELNRLYQNNITLNSVKSELEEDDFDDEQEEKPNQSTKQKENDVRSNKKS